MKLLVLGATGFVGRHLLAEGAARGDSLVGTHRPDEEFPAVAGVTWLPMDVLDGASIAQVLDAARPDGIVHLAAQANVTTAHAEPVLTFRTNAEGTLRVLEAVRRATPEARVAVVTSAELYGAVPSAELPVREDRAPDPKTPYGLSKAAADSAAAMAARAWKLRVLRMRPFNHIGPGQRRGFIVPDFASQVAASERGDTPPVLEVGNLSPRRDFTDVRDIVRGYRDALERGRDGEAYNLCSGRSVSMEEIAQYFVRNARIPLEIRTANARQRSVDLDDMRGDAGKARRDFGWEPTIPLETSLAEVLEEWRAMGPRPRRVDAVTGLS